MKKTALIVFIILSAIALLYLIVPEILGLILKVIFESIFKS